MANCFLRGKCDGSRRLIEIATEHGWVASRTQGSHLRFTKAGCKTVFFSGTPSDRRAWRNCVSKLRREEKAASAGAPA